MDNDILASCTLFDIAPPSSGLSIRLIYRPCSRGGKPCDFNVLPHRASLFEALRAGFSLLDTNSGAVCG